jgi:hypothetical protein
MADKLPGGAEGKELQKTLGPGEQVLAWAQGKASATLVATDRRALVIKAGVATGSWFGKKSVSYGYPQISAIDMNTGLMDGYVEISSAGVTQKSRVSRTNQLTQADNIVPFNKWSEGDFRKVVEVIRQKLYQPTAPQAAASSGQTIPDQIAALAQLRDSGVLSTEEFEAKKAELLARM